MGKKSTPKPPNLQPYADAMEQQGEWAFLTSQEQLKWAREQDAANRALLQQVLGPQLEAQANQAEWAKKDRARYENTFQPLEDNLIQDFQSYGTPERMAQERGRAMADVASNFDAQRRNALQRLESYGVDPSQTRNAALDVAMRTQQGAAMAAAGTCRGILETLHCQHAVHHRHPGVERDPHQALGGTIGDLLVVAGIATHHAAKRDDRGMPAGGREFTGGDRQLPGTGHAHHVDGGIKHAVGEEGRTRGLDQCIDDARVPAAGDDREARVRVDAQVAFVMRHRRAAG